MMHEFEKRAEAAPSIGCQLAHIDTSEFPIGHESASNSATVQPRLQWMTAERGRAELGR